MKARQQRASPSPASSPFRGMSLRFGAPCSPPFFSSLGFSRISRWICQCWGKEREGKKKEGGTTVCVCVCFCGGEAVALLFKAMCDRPYVTPKGQRSRN